MCCHVQNNVKYTVLQKKVYHPTTTDSYNSKLSDPSNFWYSYYWVTLPSKGGLISHLTCFVYIPYLEEILKPWKSQTEW